MIGVRPRPPPTMHAEAEFARVVAHELQADVVHQRWRRGPRRAGDRDLELARQVARIPGGTSTTGAGARSTGADRRSRRRRRPRNGRVVMLRTQLPEVWIACISTVASSARMSGTSLELRPVELDVLARGEVAVAAVVVARDVREHAQLARRQQAVRNRDAQHRRVPLDVQAVLQAQRTELVLGQLARRGSGASGRGTARRARATMRWSKAS